MKSKNNIKKSFSLILLVISFVMVFGLIIGLLNNTTKGSSNETATEQTSLITFSVGENEYQCPKNWVWSQYVNSVYSNDFSIDEDNYILTQYSYVAIGNSKVLNTDKIVAGANYSVISLLSFTIDETIYHFESNMTWADWKDSKFNKDNYIIIDNYIYSTSGVITYNNNNVLKTDTIIENAEYGVKQVISFTLAVPVSDNENGFDGVFMPCRAENGMTWAQWLISGYNYLDVTALNGYVVVDSYYIHTFGMNDFVLSDDTIISGQSYIVRDNVISFSIDNINYTAENGMTWNKWVNSPFNVCNCAVIGQNISYNHNIGYVVNNGNYVLKTDSIVANTSYTVDSTISFNIGNTTYQSYGAIVHPTWNSWVNSVFNTDNYVVVGDFIYSSQNGVVTYNGNNVLKTDIIVPNRIYTFTDTITFTSFGYSYYAINGMTWAQFVNSDFNTKPFTLGNNTINATGGSAVICDETGSVAPTDLIVANYDYDYMIPISYDTATDLVFVGGETYQVKRNATWSQWLENGDGIQTSDFVIDENDYIKYVKYGNAFVTYNGNNILRTDTIIRGATYNIPMITFTIDNVSCNAINGMTWKDWCLSDYRISGWYAEDETISKHDTREYLLYNNNFVTGNDLIITNANYTIATASVHFEINNFPISDNYVGTTGYYAISGMTWEQFILSPLTSTNFIIDSNRNISYSNGLIKYNNVSVVKTDIIIADTTYTLDYNYTITYKDGGNTTFSGTHENGYPTTHTYGTATTLKTATKSGYTFGGWFTDSACTTATNGTLGATAYTSNITLYAKWTLNTISFTIDNTSYTATNGMTWSQWVASANNTGNFTIDSNNNISCSNGLVTYNNASVVNTDTIIANATYTIVSSTPQVQTFTFSINITTYTAESGMTWADWVNSAYNIEDFYIENDSVMLNSDWEVAIVDENNNPVDDVYSADLISDNLRYGYNLVGSSSG